MRATRLEGGQDGLQPEFFRKQLPVERGRFSPTCSLGWWRPHVRTWRLGCHEDTAVPSLLENKEHSEYFEMMCGYWMLLASCG